MIRQTIAAKAKQFIGQEEILGNLGFKDEQFQEYMESVGWDKGQAWCAYFAELVWKLAYAEFNSTWVDRLDKLFSAGAVKTWRNFKYSDFVTINEPGVGDVVIWQKYKDGVPQWSGHAGIVVKVEGDYFWTVEGNTNDKGSREGYIVAEKKCTMKDRGSLKLIGFIKPLEVW